MHHNINRYDNHSIEGISIVHTKIGYHNYWECYIHAWMYASPYGNNDYTVDTHNSHTNMFNITLYKRLTGLNLSGTKQEEPYTRPPAVQHLNNWLCICVSRKLFLNFEFIYIEINTLSSSSSSKKVFLNMSVSFKIVQWRMGQSFKTFFENKVNLQNVPDILINCCDTWKYF